MLQDFSCPADVGVGGDIPVMSMVDKTVGQPAWQESSKVKSQSRDFRFIFDEKWRSTLRLKYVGLQ